MEEGLMGGVRIFFLLVTLKILLTPAGFFELPALALSSDIRMMPNKRGTEYGAMLLLGGVLPAMSNKAWGKLLSNISHIGDKPFESIKSWRDYSLP